MNLHKQDFYSLPLLSQVLYVAGIAVCLLLGVIGLILPIIPGLLFLFIAAVMLSRVSTRFAALFQDSAMMEGGMKRWHSISHLGLIERVKLSGLYLASALLNGLRRLLGGVAQR